MIIEIIPSHKHLHFKCQTGQESLSLLWKLEVHYVVHKVESLVSIQRFSILVYILN